MKTFWQLCIATTTCVLLLTSCASLRPPERPAYTGEDHVAQANIEQVVGIWQARSLNPLPGEPAQSTTVEYRANGTVSARTKPDPRTEGLIGQVNLTINGKWTLTNDVVSHSDIEFSSNDDDAMGSMISKMMNSMNNQSLADSGNIYELDANRMVIVGSDGAAMEYIRQ